MLETLLREAFEIWYQPGVLGNHQLIKELSGSIKKQCREKGYSNDIHGQAEALREVVRLGISLLAVEGEAPPDGENDPKWFDKQWRYYNILTLSHMPNMTTYKIATRIGLQPDGGRFNEERRTAFEMLASVLLTLEETLNEECNNIDLTPPGNGLALSLTDKRYIEREADDILMNMTPRGQIRTFTIRGAKQMGKTSLLIRVANRLKQQFKAKVIHFSLEIVGHEHLSSLERFLYQLALSIADSLEIDTAKVRGEWKDRLLSPLLRMEFVLKKHVLPELQTPIVLALDNVDLLLPFDFCSDFFGMLRTWNDKGASADNLWEKLIQILVISTEPALLIKDPYQSPFNVGLEIHLDDFDEQQVGQLNSRYGSPLAEKDIPKVISMLNGHPYLVNIAFYTMLNRGITWSELEPTMVTDQGPYRVHLRYLRNLLEKDSDLKTAFREIVHSKQCSDEHAQFRLLKAGLIKRTEAYYTCRCNLYHQYFGNKL